MGGIHYRLAVGGQEPEPVREDNYGTHDASLSVRALMADKPEPRYTGCDFTPWAQAGGRPA